MPDNVTQVEGLDFTVQDHATAPADRMAKSFEHVHHAAEGVTRKLGEMTHHAAMSGLAMVGLGFGLREIANKAGEANLELENSAKKIAGVQYTFGGWKKGTTEQEKWSESLDTSTGIVAKLDEAGSRLKLTQGELADIYKSSYALGQRYNLNQEQQIAMTEKFGAVQKVLGVSAEFAAMQVYRMATTGRARGFDDFSKKMRESVGDLKAFGKLSEEKRFQKLQKAMGDLMPAAEGMGKGIAGSMFDVRKAIDELTRDLTGPLFKEVTKDFSEWAHKLGEVRAGGQSAAAEWGGKLVTAFGYLKDATAFIADHWKTIAGIFIATKFTGAMQGLAGRFGASAAAGGTAGAAGGVAGVMNVKAATVNVSSGAAAALGTTTAAEIGAKLKPSLSETVTKFSNMAARAGMVTEALGGLYIGLDALAKWALSKQDEGMAKQASAPRAMNALTAGAKAMSSALHEESVEKTFGHLKAAFQAYGLKPGQSLDRATVASELRAMQPELAAKQIAMYGIKGASAKNVQAPGMLEEAAGRITTLLNNFAAQLLAGNPSLANGGSSRALAGKAVTQINIAHMEITQDFKQADPDRVFHNVPRDIVDMVNSPRASGVAAVAG